MPDYEFNAYYFVGVIASSSDSDSPVFLGAMLSLESDDGDAISIDNPDVGNTIQGLQQYVESSDGMKLISNFAVPAAGGSGEPVVSGETYGLSDPHRNHLRYEAVPLQSFIRMAQHNDDGTITPKILAFSPWLGYSTPYGEYAEFTKWLNTDEDIAAFEEATGLKLKDMELIHGDSIKRHPERFSPGETVLGEPIVCIVEYHNVWDRETRALKLKRDGETLVERKSFKAWGNTLEQGEFEKALSQIQGRVAKSIQMIPED